MSHELSMMFGKAEMAWTGETPWHGLGQQLKAGASLAAWIKAANFGWKINAGPVRYDHGNEVLTMDERVVLHRSDTGAPLGVVGKGYKPVHPAEIIEFFRRLTEVEGFQLETAGALFGGKRLWGLARVGKKFSVSKGDDVQPYLLLATACDGTMKTTARFTSVRAVCNNTLSVAVKGKAEVSISHRSAFNADTVHEQLGIATEGAAQLSHDADKLAKLKITDKEAEAFVAKLVQDAVFVIADDLESVKKSKPYQSIMGLFMGGGQGAELVSAKGTGWGMLNAVTQYSDFNVKGKTPDHKLASAWFGKGQDAKQLAYNGLLARV